MVAQGLTSHDRWPRRLSQSGPGVGILAFKAGNFQFAAGFDVIQRRSAGGASIVLLDRRSVILIASVAVGHKRHPFDLQPGGAEKCPLFLGVKRKHQTIGLDAGEVPHQEVNGFHHGAIGLRHPPVFDGGE